MYNKRFCKEPEKIENYEKALADNFKGWECHHRLQTWTSDGERRLVNISAAELKALGMYYNRPASELIFLTVSEHRLLHNEGEHNPMYGKQGYWKGKTGPNKGKIAGENNPMYGKHHSLSSIQKMSKAMKGKPGPNKGKHFSEEHKKNIGAAKKGNKNMLGKKHSAESKKKMSEAKKGNTYAKGRHWYNNGKEAKFCFDCPPGFTPGRLR